MRNHQTDCDSSGCSELTVVVAALLDKPDSLREQGCRSGTLPGFYARPPCTSSGRHRPDIALQAMLRVRILQKCTAALSSTSRIGWCGVPGERGVYPVFSRRIGLRRC
jgi:hypothetical protein